MREAVNKLSKNERLVRASYVICRDYITIELTKQDDRTYLNN